MITGSISTDTETFTEGDRHNFVIRIMSLPTFATTSLATCTAGMEYVEFLHNYRDKQP